jgi:hypothetical protein
MSPTGDPFFTTKGRKNMKVVFIVGPYRAPNAWGVEKNVRAAENIGLTVAGFGAMPLIPHTNTRFFDGLLTDEFWLDGTSELMKRSDAVVCVPGWEYSAGSIAEINLARKLNMPVLSDYGDSDVDGRRNVIRGFIGALAGNDSDGI